MHTIKTCRFTTAKDGSLEVTITIPAQAVAMAEDFAARLPSSRDQVLTKYLEQCFDSIHEGIEDYCLVSWKFPTAAEGESFIKREKLDLRGTSLVEWEDGSGFSVATLYQLDNQLALILEERAAKSAAA
jgi:hypothetical protein